MGKWKNLKEEEEEEDKKKKKKRQMPTGRERERVTYEYTMTKFSAIVWGTWWCNESTKLLTFQFFYCCGTSPRCVGMKIRIFFPFYLLRWLLKYICVHFKDVEWLIIVIFRHIYLWIVFYFTIFLKNVIVANLLLAFIKVHH